MASANSMTTTVGPTGALWPCLADWRTKTSSAQWETAFRLFATLSRTFWARSGSGWNDGKLDAATFPKVQSLELRWETIEHDQTQFIEALTPQRLVEELAYLNQRGQLYSYPLWKQMVHVVNHSSYHRGQVTTLLRQLGAEAVSTDFLVYYDEKSKQSSIAP